MVQVRIIAEFRTQTSLSEGCNVILRHDCLVLAQASSGKCSSEADRRANAHVHIISGITQPYVLMTQLMRLQPFCMR